MQTETQHPHARAWLYVGLLFAQGYPVGTHPRDNPKLLECTGGPHGCSQMLEAVLGVSLMNGYSGGAA